MAKKAKSTDEEIVKLVIGGDVDSFGELMMRYESKLSSYVYYLIGRQSPADDIVQEVFIKAYQNLRGFNFKYKFSSWIYRIAHNEAMSAVRRNRFVDSEIEVEEIEDKIHFGDFSERIDRKITKKRVAVCLSKLDKKYREIMILQYFENMKYSEISDVLHLPISTVGVRSKRAKEKLKRLCEEEGVMYD